MKVVKAAVRAFDLFVVLVTVVILLMVSVFTVPRLFGIVPFVVRSGSMGPAIPTGSIVFVNRNDQDVEVGDIVTIHIGTGESAGVYITHRVHQVNAERKMIQTKGDANDSPDGFLDESAVYGKVMLHIPKVGFVLNTLQQERGYVTLVAFVCGINAMSLFFDHVVERVGKKKDCQPKGERGFTIKHTKNLKGDALG